MSSIAVCMTCFNRREKTLACLRSLFANRLPEETSLTVYLLDDASPDRTGEAVRNAFPEVRLFKGDGNCFWAGGMRAVYHAALREGHDYYLWLNDDVSLFPDAIFRALEASRQLAASDGALYLLGGAMRAPDSDATTYSGQVRSSTILPWKFKKIAPDPRELRECNVLNGNFLLIPRAVADKLGNIDAAYIQMQADFDYSLRAYRAGGRSWLLPGYAGVCEQNTTGRKNFKDPKLSLRERLRLMEHPLGYPWRPNLVYSRNFGPWAPLVFVAPYLGVVSASLRSWLRAAFTKK